MKAHPVPAETLEKLAAEQGPLWPSRKAAWLDGFREGEQHARMTGAANDQLRALHWEEFKELLLASKEAVEIVARRRFERDYPNFDWDQTMPGEKKTRRLEAARVLSDAAAAISKVSEGLE